jgi:ureidoacrylate peracid hydrolase
VEKERRGGIADEDLAPDRAALLLVDMQNDFVSPQGRMAQYGFDVSDVGAIVAPLSRLLAAARRAGVLVVHTRMVNDAALNAPSWHDFWGEPTVALPGTWGAAHVEALAPLPTEIVIEKFGYGAFFGTNLDTVLRRAGTRTTVVAGTGPGICAGETLHQAFALGYHVVAVSDGLASFSVRESAYNQTLTETALYTVEHHYGRVMTSEELKISWGQRGGP